MTDERKLSRKEMANTKGGISSEPIIKPKNPYGISSEPEYKPSNKFKISDDPVYKQTAIKRNL